MWSVPSRFRLASQDRMARRAHFVRPVAHPEGGLGRDQHLVAPALQRLAQDLLRHALAVDVGGVEEIDPGLKTQIDHAAGLGDIGAAPALEELVGAAEGGGAEAEHGNLEAGSAELTVFHASLRW